MRPGLYTFHTEGDKILGYTVLFFKPEGDINDPYLKMSPEEVISSRPLKMKERFSLNRIGRRRLYPFPPAEEGVTNILLFCPDDFVCREISADRTIECGGEFCSYTVYNTALFLRGRLGEYLNHPGEVRHTGSESAAHRDGVDCRRVHFKKFPKGISENISPKKCSDLFRFAAFFPLTKRKNCAILCSRGTVRVRDPRTDARCDRNKPKGNDRQRERRRSPPKTQKEPTAESAARHALPGTALPPVL